MPQVYSSDFLTKGCRTLRSLIRHLLFILGPLGALRWGPAQKPRRCMCSLRSATYRTLWYTVKRHHHQGDGAHKLTKPTTNRERHCPGLRTNGQINMCAMKNMQCGFLAWPTYETDTNATHRMTVRAVASGRQHHRHHPSPHHHHHPSPHHHHHHRTTTTITTHHATSSRNLASRPISSMASQCARTKGSRV